MFPLELSLKPSPLITSTLVTLGLMVGGGAWMIDAPVWFSVCVSVLAVGETWRQVLEHGLRRASKSVIAIRWLDVFEWFVECKAMPSFACQDVRVEFMSSLVITLSVPGRWNLRKKIWITKDSVGDKPFRQLTTGLKLLDHARHLK